MRSRINMGILKRTGVILSSFVLIFAFQNCAEQSFSDAPLQNIKTDTGGPNCRDVLETIKTPIELISVVDMSGSNKTHNGVGTDPDKEIRAGSLGAFYNTYKSKTNFSWSLVTFAGSSASTLAKNANASDMYAAMQALLSTEDKGGTPYAAALDRAKKMIDDDTSTDPNKKYVVVFWSDGLPDPAISDDDLKTKVQAIIDTHPGRVSMNTVYYGAPNQVASDRLKMVAETGGGNFLDTNKNSTGTVFSISDLVVVPGEICD